MILGMSISKKKKHNHEIANQLLKKKSIFRNTYKFLILVYKFQILVVN